MASNVTRDHHSLRRNLRLNNKYISNDGGDEGITVTDAGAVAISSTIELGHATDTTLARASSGEVNIEGNVIYRADGTVVAITDGGTGASNSNAWLNSRITTNADGSLNYDATGATAVNHDSLTGFDADEHIDWTASSAGTIHSSNYVDNNTNTLTTWTLRDDDNDSFTIAHSKFLKVVAATGTLGTNIAGSGTTEDPWVLTITSPDTTTNTQNEYATSWVDSSADVLLRLTESGAGSGTQDIKLVAGTGISLTPSGTDMTIANTVSAVTNHVTNDADDTMAGTLTIDKDSTSTSEATTKGLEIDYDHTGSTDTNQTIMGLDVSATSGSTTGGAQIMYGAKIRSQLTAASGLGDITSYGLYSEVLGNTNAAIDRTYAGYFKASGADVNNGLYINNQDGGIDFKNVSSAVPSDYFTINTIEDGETTLTTVENSGGSTAHLNMVADGDFHVDAVGNITLDAGGGDVAILQADVKIPATKKLYLDGGGDTSISESSADSVKHDVGGSTVMMLSEAGNAGNLVNFGGSCAGFKQFEPTYDATDTTVFFNRLGNKAHLTFTSASETIEDVELSFPNVSCNCVLLIKQHASGGGAVTNWKTFDQAGGNESTVAWAGGDAPTLTTGGSKIDIMSFYWDNDNHKAYGVASLNF